MALAMEGKSPLAPENSVPNDSFDLRRLARIMDHTMLRPQATCEEIGRFCREAVSLGVGAVAIYPVWVPMAARHLHGTGVKVGTVVGFPFGATHASAKRAEAEASIRAGADYVKTSTGFGPSGSTEADVRLMRKTVGPSMGVKAAGGIRSLGEALKMLEAGADRLGTSASAAILAEAGRRVG